MHSLCPFFTLLLLGCSYCLPTLDQWVFTGQHTGRLSYSCHRAHQQVANLMSLLSFWTLVNSSPSEKQIGGARSHHTNLIKFGNYLADYVCHYCIIPTISWWGTSGMSLQPNFHPFHKWNNCETLSVITVYLVLVVPPWVLFSGRASWLLLVLASVLAVIVSMFWSTHGSSKILEKCE